MYRQVFKAHPILCTMHSMRFAQQTNFPVTPKEWGAIEDLLLTSQAARVDSIVHAHAVELAKRDYAEEGWKVFLVGPGHHCGGNESVHDIGNLYLDS